MAFSVQNKQANKKSQPSLTFVKPNPKRTKVVNFLTCAFFLLAIKGIKENHTFGNYAFGDYF